MKDYPRALLEFKNAARVAPHDAEPHYQTGLVYLYSGDYRAAIGSFRLCLDFNPRHVGAQLKTAELMTSSAKPETLSKAAAQLREVLALSPQNTGATDALALTEWRLGNHEEAIERLKELLQQLPASLSSSVMLARMKLSGKDLAGAEQILKNASAAEPQSSAAALALGEMYLVTGQVVKAEPEILRAIRLDGQNGQALLALAAIQTAANRADAVEETYRRVAALKEKQYRPLYALFLLQRGKQQEGLAELERLARQDPADRMARTRLVAALIQSGQSNRAEELLNEALKKSARDTDALIDRGSLNLRTGRVNDAQRDLEQALQLLPQNADAHRYLALTYKTQGQLQNERRELIEVLKLRKENQEARLALARNYLISSEPKAAIHVLEELPSAYQNQLPVIAERNWALLGMNDLTALRASLKTALQVGRNPVLLVQQSLLEMAARNYPQARANAEEVLRSNPRDERAGSIVAESYLAQNQPAKALESLTNLAQAAPDSARIRYMLGLGHLSAGNLLQAREQFEAAHRNNPAFTPADLALADLDRRQGRDEAAKVRLSEVIAKDTANVDALLLLAEIERSSGNHAAAIARYRAVLAVDSSNLIALNNLSTELTSDSPDEALGFAQRAFDLAPGDPAVQDTLGWIYYRKGFYRVAAQHLQEAMAKEPNPRRQLHLGLSYMKTGDLRQGRELLNAATRQDPSLRSIAGQW